MNTPRVGFGYDVHRLEESLPLHLGGILIPSPKGALGHSDADVLIHAIMDALLGACGLRDIGHYFPDSDPSLEGVDSKLLLEHVIKMIHEHGYALSNMDATICLQQPKIADYIPSMKQVLAQIMQVNQHQLSIKATTTEGLGFVGTGQGVSAYAVVVVVTVNNER
jgi:2-C-methyl-D-erythritol 2,4-cyclodiphosphate synthase